jgi:acyl carrier protein
LLDRVRMEEAPRAAVPSPAKPWREYANEPLEYGFRQQLVPRLREYLKTRLPEYMVPSGWMVLSRLPLTPNGKLDRNALPAPHGRPEDMADYIAPRTELERRIAAAWAEVLHLDQVGARDNFFELGGHSLIATQIAARIGAMLSIDMPMRLLFEFPTVEQLSAQVEGIRHESLLHDLEGHDSEMQELIEEVVAMPESRVQELMRELGKE